MPIRMSGMISGMDTESIVSAMVATHVAKKQKYQKAQTKLSWKQDAWKDVNTKVLGLYNKIRNMRFSSAYNMKKTTVSDSTKAMVSAGGSAINGTQTLEIKELAKSAYLTGAKLKADTTAKTTLGELGYTGEDTTITLRMASGNKDIAVGKDTKISDLVSELNEAGVKANYDAGNNRIFVSAAGTGSANDFSLTASNMSGLEALASAGLSVVSKETMDAYNVSAAYAMGTMGIDEGGNVVSYFKLDADGKIMYDADGKAMVNEGVTYSEEETKKSIQNILKQLAEAYKDNESMAAEKKELERKISYSEAKDEITSFVDSKGADASRLVELLKKASPSETEKEEIDTLSRSLGLVTTTEQEGGIETTDDSGLKALKKNLKTVMAIEDNGVISDPTVYYLDEGERQDAQTRITEIEAATEANQATIAANSEWDVKDYSAYYNPATQTLDMTKLETLAASVTEKITTAKGVVDGSIKIPISEGATRIDAQDARIILNGAEFTSESNTFNINELTIKATGVTKEGEPITISTDTDTQGLYDMIKGFLSEYNSVINEITGLYNADSAAGYEPLTDEEKDAMSDSEVEKWENKIKGSLLRRDTTLGGIMNAMTSAMMKSYTINGKNYSLGSFGIQTLGYLNASKNENYAYHIDGDSEDEVTSGKTDRLMEALTKDPDSVIDFMKQLTGGLYTELNNRMGSTSLSSFETIYNDKQMASEYSSYTRLIATWEDKIADMEDRYYKQYSAMETQLAKLQNSTSSLSSFFGG